MFEFMGPQNVKTCVTSRNGECFFLPVLFLCFTAFKIPKKVVKTSFSSFFSNQNLVEMVTYFFLLYSVLEKINISIIAETQKKKPD